MAIGTQCPRCGWIINNITSEKQAKIKQEYPNAFKPWVSTEDHILTDLVSKRTPLLEISDTLGRQPSAVQRRIDLLKIHPSKADSPAPNDYLERGNKPTSGV